MTSQRTHRLIALGAAAVGFWTLSMSIGATNGQSEADLDAHKPTPAPTTAPSSLAPGQSPPLTTAPATAPATQPIRFQPLRDAQRGERVHYEALDDRRLEYEIVETTSETAAVRVTVAEAGKIIGQPFVRRESRLFDPIAPAEERQERPLQPRPVTLEAAGRKWASRLYTTRWTEEGVDYVRHTWVSDAVPVFGLVKMELRGDEKLEAKLALVGFECGSD